MWLWLIVDVCSCLCVLMFLVKLAGLVVGCYLFILHVCLGALVFCNL